MNRLSAAVVIVAAAFAAGCSSSVDNPPDVGPTDPTMGNGAPPTSGSLSPDRALFAPNQGVLPYPHDAYFTPTPGVPTDGTLNLPSSAFFPATVRIPGTTTTEPVVNALDGFSTQAPIKLRFSSAVDITTAAAGIRLVEVHVDPATKATIGFPTDLEPGAPRAHAGRRLPRRDRTEHRRGRHAGAARAHPSAVAEQRCARRHAAA